MIDAELGYVCAGELNKAEERIAELEQQLASLREAVLALPVEELVQEGRYGELELLGYVMQCQEEWVTVRRLCKAQEGE